MTNVVGCGGGVDEGKRCRKRKSTGAEALSYLLAYLAYYGWREPDQTL
jgi:hypothetical protein